MVKYKKVKVILLCMAAAGVMAGCGAGNGGKDTAKTEESQTSTSSTQEKAATDSATAEKEEKADAADDKDTSEAAKDETVQPDKSTADETAEKEEQAANAQAESEQDTKDTSTPSWEFTAADLDGNEVTQDILKEKKLTMVNYWATFCGPCLREMPDLGQLNEEYADKDFQIVGVITDAYRDAEGEHNIDVAQEVVESTAASYVHLPLTMELLGGPVGSVQAVPTTIFVDENGNKVGEIQVGSKSKEDWAEIIDAYLELV